MAGDLLGCKDSLPLLQYGDHFRETRKQFHRVIGTRTAIEAYHDLESVEIHKFLKRVLADPEQLVAHIRMYVGYFIVLYCLPHFRLQDYWCHSFADFTWLRS